jgi:uncharacterized MnhB-related membrane protein
MKALFTAQMVVLLFVLVRSADLAITNALVRSIIRAIVYGVVALLALIAVILTLIA